MMWEDPIVAEVRKARDELAARFDYDIELIFADLIARQGKLGDRLVSRMTSVGPPRNQPTVPDIEGKHDPATAS